MMFSQMFTPGTSQGGKNIAEGDMYPEGTVYTGDRHGVRPCIPKSELGI